MRIFVISIVAIACAVTIASAEPQQTATYTVEIAGTWEADALAAALRADLADDVLRVPRTGAVADLVIRGDVFGASLRYTIALHESGARRGVAPVRGAIELAGLDRVQLAGILRDQLHQIVRPNDTTEPGAPAEVPEPGAIGGALVALLGLAAVLAIPIVLALRYRVRRTRGARRIAVALVGIAGVAYALVVHGESVPELGGAVMLAGGLAWGAFGAVMLPVAMPPLLGVHRVEESELAFVLRAWFGLALQRTLGVALLYAPLVVVVWLAGEALALPIEITLGVVAPIVALGVRLAWRAAVEVVAARLDRELVADTSGAWHPQVRAYLVGYLRRANVEVDTAALDHIQFLPGREADVAVYGGGLTHTRVVIPRAMLEHALAPYGRPHDYPMPRVSTLHWTHWNAGLVMPTEAGAKLASAEDRKPHVTVDEGEHERIALGEPPTFSGIVEPQALDPRTSYRPDEDPLWLDWDPGEEFDGTDAGDKDYLFGLLVHALGVRQRHEDRAGTIACALRRSKSRIAMLAVRAIGGVRWLAARRAARLGDVHAVLGGARHHLVQYIAWQLWSREDLTTARAYVPELEQTSRKIAAALAADVRRESERTSEPAQRSEAAQRATESVLRRRLDELQVFVGAPPTAGRRRRVRLAIAAIAGAAIIAAVVQAVLYHPTYEARIAAEHERLDDGR